ncbi:hypothetical protein L1049_025087 [Liquidambar formosana]|uniref:Uncharacterized protein n=1 Tax=Liquidambar formosana TaxID=63359 RepID=A0AAP0S1N7_LIQFO
MPQIQNKQKDEKKQFKSEKKLGRERERERELRCMMVARRAYTWVASAKALGNTITTLKYATRPNWYFWFPLYACAFLVNLIYGFFTFSTIRKIAEVALWLGMFLFAKVVVEDFVHGIAGVWSLDLSERVVREKIGSGLVVISMFLQLEASSIPKDPIKIKRKKKEVARIVEYGMAILVGVSYGLPFVFFVIRKGEMKF